VIFVYERLFTPNVGLELVIGLPPKLKATGAGSAAFLGEVLSVRTVSPTLLLNYHFLSPSDALRPYVGAGVNYTRFTSISSTLAPDVKMGDSTGLALQAGSTTRSRRTSACSPASPSSTSRARSSPRARPS
jgi:Outer membrane protein W